ncbi:MAG TPA: S9 family peptidase, partial [Chloroflexota bacterium]
MPEETSIAAPPTLRWPLEPRLAYPVVTEVAPAPDGRHVAYAVREPLLTVEKSEFLTHLYLAARDGGEPVQLTYGDSSDSNPAWSPDGRYLAFLSKRSGKGNIYVLHRDGGEAWPLTRYEKTDVTGLRWSPDGTRIGFLMAEPPSEEKEKQQKARDDATRFGVDVDFTHLFTVPFAVGPRSAPEATQLTHGRLQVIDFDWSPGGDQIAFTHQPTPDADSWPGTRLAVISADGSADSPSDIALVAVGGARPSFSPDGLWLACTTGEQPARWAGAAAIALYPRSPKGAAPEQHSITSLATTPDSGPHLLGWASNGQAVYVLEASGTASQILAVPRDGSPAQSLGAVALHLSAAAANRQGQVAFVGQDLHQAQAVYLLDTASGETTQIAQPPLPADWPQTTMPRAEVIRWQAPDGMQIEGILIYPLDYEPGRRYPLILHVHGGPAGVFGRTFLGSPGGQVDALGLAERGYAILRANPRGSGGYGKAFRHANQGDWGGGDYRDLMAGVDHLIAQGLADPDRLGVAGWSYGGFMTSWIITQTRRFQAACIGAPVTDPVSFNGTSDIAGFIPDYFGAESWDDRAAYERQSPLAHVKGFTTPALIQHGADDVRVPLGQGREFFNALKRQGVPSELVIYPRQGHGIGEPRLMLDVTRRATAWLERWIPAGPATKV